MAYLTETARTQCVDFERASTDNLRVTLVSTADGPRPQTCGC